MQQRKLLTATLLAAMATASCALIANLGDRTLDPFLDGGGVTTDATAPQPDGSVTSDGGSDDGSAASDVVIPPFDAPPGCVLTGYPAALVEAQIYLAVDSSGSMGQALPSGPTRYAAELGAVTSFVSDPLSASLYCAMDTHPDARGDAGCSPALYDAPPVPMGQLGAGNAAAITAQLTPLVPTGGSPWSVMLTGALQFATTSQQSAPARATALVFMADSTPNLCAIAAPELTAIVAPPAQGVPPIRTFFVGITQVAADVAQFMDPIAQAGGTGTAFATVPPTQATLLAALVAIRNEVACVVKLPLVGTKPADLTKGGLFLQTAAGQVTTAPVANAAACAAAGDAWYPEAVADRVHLCPKACNRLLGEATAKPTAVTCRP